MITCKYNVQILGFGISYFNTMITTCSAQLAKCRNAGNLKTSISNDKCAKGNNKENEKNSKVSWKGGKLYKAQEKLARGAGVNVGEYLCISHRDEVMRANNCCSFPSRNSTQHSRALVLLPRHLYQQIDKIGAGVQDYQPGCKWCTKCKKMEGKLD